MNVGRHSVAMPLHIHHAVHSSKPRITHQPEVIAAFHECRHTPTVAPSCRCCAQDIKAGRNCVGNAANGNLEIGKGVAVGAVGCDRRKLVEHVQYRIVRGVNSNGTRIGHNLQLR